MPDDSNNFSANKPISWATYGAWPTYKKLQLIWPEWLVPGLIPKDSSICLYGKRGLGKTFLALDLALCIATGEPWNGRKVIQGRVAYLLAERPDGLKRRIAGWLKHRGVSEDKLGNNFIAARSTHALNRRDSLDQTLQALNADSDKNGPFSLVVFDPLISFLRGFENDSRDMQEFIHGVREVVGEDQEEEKRAANKHPLRSVLVVHHEGKSNGPFFKGARGSSALEAGMDTVMHLKGKASEAIIDTTKQREQVKSPPIGLEFISIRDSQNRDLGMFPDIREIKEKPNREATKKPSALEEHKYVLQKILKGTSEESPLDKSRIDKAANTGEFKSIQASLKEQSIQRALNKLSIPHEEQTSDKEQELRPFRFISHPTDSRKNLYFLNPKYSKKKEPTNEPS